MTYVKLVAALVVSLTFAVTAWSREPDEVREKARAMPRIMKQLDELRQAVGRLQDEVHELRERRFY